MIDRAEHTTLVYYRELPIWWVYAQDRWSGQEILMDASQGDKVIAYVAELRSERVEKYGGGKGKVIA